MSPVLLKKSLFTPKIQFKHLNPLAWTFAALVRTLSLLHVRYSSVCVASSSPYSVKGGNTVETNVSNMGDGGSVGEEDGAGLLHRNRQQFYQNMLVSHSAVIAHCYNFSRLRCRSCWRSLQQVHRAAY